MKQNVMVALSVVGVIVWGGVAVAGGMVREPEPNTWEYAVALETGKLPADSSGIDTAKHTASPDATPVIEVGGVLYRVGVDTQ